MNYELNRLTMKAVKEFITDVIKDGKVNYCELPMSARTGKLIDALTSLLNENHPKELDDIVNCIVNYLKTCRDTADLLELPMIVSSRLNYNILVNGNSDNSSKITLKGPRTVMDRVTTDEDKRIMGQIDFCKSAIKAVLGSVDHVEKTVMPFDKVNPTDNMSGYVIDMVVESQSDMVDALFQYKLKLEDKLFCVDSDKLADSDIFITIAAICQVLNESVLFAGKFVPADGVFGCIDAVKSDIKAVDELLNINNNEYICKKLRQDDAHIINDIIMTALICGGTLSSITDVISSYLKSDADILNTGINLSIVTKMITVTVALTNYIRTELNVGIECEDEEEEIQ